MINEITGITEIVLRAFQCGFAAVVAFVLMMILSSILWRTAHWLNDTHYVGPNPVIRIMASIIGYKFCKTEGEFIGKGIFRSSLNSTDEFDMAGLIFLTVFFSGFVITSMWKIPILTVTITAIIAVVPACLFMIRYLIRLYKARKAIAV